MQVAVEWRDAYTLTCLLRADSVLQLQKGSPADANAAVGQQHRGAHGENQPLHA